MVGPKTKIVMGMITIGGMTLKKSKVNLVDRKAKRDSPIKIPIGIAMMTEMTKPLVAMMKVASSAE